MRVTYQKNQAETRIPRKINKITTITITNNNNINKNILTFKEIIIPAKIRKKRSGSSKKSSVYFTKETEEAIIEYNSATDQVKKNDIYNEKIKYAFEKLVENIFNTFKFSYCDSTPINIQQEVVSHLISNIHRFKSTKGKAFSYFSIIAKNYLIAHNNSNYKNANKHVNISEKRDEDTICLQAEDKFYINEQRKEFLNLLIDYWDENVTKIFTKNRDLNIAYAIIEIMRNCDRIEYFNKKSLYLCIREISNCKTQHIANILNKMKKYYKILVKNYYCNGEI